MIFGCGIDIVEVSRIEAIIEKHRTSFLDRVFSVREIDYCREKVHPPMHFAARFAAKEAFLKALGLGLGMGISLRDIEVVTDERGRPFLSLLGGAAQVFKEKKLRAPLLSISHTKALAIAQVVLVK